MGKRLILQRRGKGSPKYRALKHRFITEIKYPRGIENSIIKVLDFKNDPARSCVLARVLINYKHEEWILAPKGMYTGMIIDNRKETTELGSIAYLEKIPTGTRIFNIGIRKKEKGVICRAGGSYGTLFSKDFIKEKIKIILKNKREKIVDFNCLATVGIASGGYRHLKPLLKAGNSFYKYRSKKTLFPRTSAIAKNVFDHPFGGSGRKKPGRPRHSGRNYSPGQKVGSVAPSRTGKKR